MVDQDITQTLETIETKPNEAIENIAQASKEGSDPDSYAQSNGGVDPSKKVKETVVDRKLASEMEKSSQVASAVSVDVDKMNWSAKMGNFAGLSIRQSDASRERARLANEVRELRKQGKPVPEDTEWNLAAVRDEANSIGADIEKLNLGDISKGIGSIPTFLTDQFKDMWKQKEIVAGSTASGSAAGAVFGSMTVPLLGTFTGVLGGGATGFVVGSMAASARENYLRTSGEVYDELSMASRPDGTPLNISEEEKDSIATGVGLVTSGIEIVADKIGAELIPVLKRAISPKYVREAAVDPVKMGVLKSLGNLAKKIAAGGLAEGSTEAIQEYAQMLGGELGQTWNGKESSLGAAINNLNSKIANDPKTQQRLKSAATIGAVAGGAIVGAGNLIPTAKEVVTGKPSGGGSFPDSSTMVGVTPNPAPEPRGPSDFIQIENGVPVSMTPQKSVNLAVALKGISDATMDTTLGKNAPIDAEALQARMLKESGINEVWVAPEDLNKWANTQKKADYIRTKFTPSQIKDLELGASVAVDPATVLEMIREDEAAAKFVRPSADGMSFDEVVAAYETGSKQAQEFMKNQGLAQATDAPVAEAQGQAVPLEIEKPLNPGWELGGIALKLENVPAKTITLNNGEQVTFKAEMVESDDNASDPKIIWPGVSITNNKGQRVGYIQIGEEDGRPASMMTKIVPEYQRQGLGKELIRYVRQNVADLEPSKSQTPAGMAVWDSFGREEQSPDLNEQEIADAAFEAYMSTPLMTDLVRAGVPRESLKKLETQYNDIRSRIVEATQEAADKEMGQVNDQLVDLAMLEEGLDSVVKATNDPNVAVVEIFLANRKTLAIDPDTLSVEQRIRYIDDGVLDARKAFKKGGIDPESLALQLGLENGDVALEVLSKTPDRKRAAENAKRFSQEILSLDAADAIEISSASILKVITDKQKMNMAEFKYFVETNWVKARNGIEGIMFSQINLENIRVESKTKIQQTKLSALNPKAYERASKLAAKRKVKSALRGDTLQSAVQREVEIRADEMLKQTYETIGKSNRAIKQINRMMRNPSILDSLSEAGMQDAFVDFANIVNLGEKRTKTDVGAFQRLADKLNSDQTSDISIPQELLNTFDPRATLKDLSYEQVDFIRNKMRELVKLAEQTNTFREGQEQKAFDVVKDQFIEDIKKTPGYDASRTDGTSEFDSGVVDAVTAKFDLIDSSMTNIQYIMTQATNGDDLSPAHQFVVDQLFGIGNYENSGYGYSQYTRFKAEWQKRIAQKLKQFGESRMQSYGYTWVDAPELAGSTNLLNKNGRILKSQLMNAVALYGSETGRQRLSNFGVEPDLIFEVAKKHLTNEDFDFIQEGVHDSFDLMRPEIERVFKDQGREAPDFVEGLGYEVDGKKYRGGYFNIRYRDDVSVDVANRQDQQKVAQLTGDEKSRPMEPEFLKDMTRQGQYETRVDTYKGVPSLDFATNYAIGIENVITDLSMNIPIKEVMKLLTDKEVSNELIRSVGFKKFDILKNHVMSAGKSLSSQQLALFKNIEGLWSSLFDSIGRNVVGGTLLGLPSSILAQFTSGVYMWHSQGLRSTGTYLNTWVKMILNPKVNLKQMIEWAATIDPSIGQYAYNIDERTFGEIYNILPKRRSDFKVNRWAQTGGSALSNLYFSTGMNTIDTMQKTSAIATAYGRFLSGKTKGYDVKTLAKLPDAEKVRLAKSYAFNQVNRTGTSGTILDRAYFQKSGVFKGFASYFNDTRNIYNYSITYAGRPIKTNVKGIIADVKSGDIKGATVKIFDTGYRLATLQMATAIAAMMLKTIRGRDDEGEEMPAIFTMAWEVEFFKTLIDPTTIVGVVASGPAVLRDVFYSVDSAIESEGRYINQVAPIHIKAINNIVTGIYALNQLVMNQELSEKETKLLLKGVGTVVPNVPFNAVGKLITESDPKRSTIDAIASDPGIMISAVAYSAWVVQQAISRGQFTTAGAAEEIHNTYINPTRSFTVKDLLQDQAKALTPEEIGIIGYTESAGSQKAVSSIGAAGLYQFTEKTWEGLMFQYPELGLTYAGRTAKNTRQQEIAMDRLVRDNAVRLLQNNVEINLNSVYAAHHFGSGKIAKLWNLPDDTPVKSIIGDDAYRANPWLRGKVSWINNNRPVRNVGDFKRGLEDLLDSGRKQYNDDAMRDFALD